MIPETTVQKNLYNNVNKAFSKQSLVFDEEDAANPILQYMRSRYYRHVTRYLKPGSRILELNAGTGIDAIHFIHEGHYVHATDLSDGMVSILKEKSGLENLNGKLTVQQVSFDALDEIKEQKFDCVLSNFGGLNCIADLSDVTRHLSQLLNPGAFVTVVIMPPVCFWELGGLLKGNFKNALRRLNRNGVVAHLEGEYFTTFYHSLEKIKKSFPPEFRFISSIGLGAIIPPPYKADFVSQHRSWFIRLKQLEENFAHLYPFTHCADHIMVTFRFKG